MKQTNHIDGWLYVGVAVCAAVTASLGSDEATKFITPEYLFKLKTVTAALGAGLLAGKMYRSTTFANVLSNQSPVENQVAIPAVQPPPSQPEKPPVAPAEPKP